MAEVKEQFESLVQTVADVKKLVQEHVKDPATLDEKKVEQIVMDKLAAQKQAEVVHAGEKALESDWVGPEGAMALDPVIKDGKYAGRRRSELEFVHSFLSRAHALDKHVHGPSDMLTKALSATGSGTGDELVPVGMASRLWDDIHLQSQIVSNLPNRISMPTDPFELPLNFGALTWYKGVSVTGTTATNVATAKSTLTATEQIAEIDWEYDLEEDAVLAVQPALRANLAREAAEQMDAFVLNADSTDANNINSHDDGDAEDDNWFLSKGEDGLRHMAFVDHAASGISAAGNALDDKYILSMLAGMGKYAARPNDCMMICDTATLFKGFMNLDGVQTLDKYGPSAVLLTGEIARYRGIPIIPSASMKQTEADAFVNDTPSGTTYGQIVCPNRNCWTVGFKRDMLIEVDKDIQKREWIMVVSFRIAVASYGGATKTALTHTGGVYYISVA